MQHSITLLLGQIAFTQPGDVLCHCPIEKQMIVPLSWTEQLVYQDVMQPVMTLSMVQLYYLEKTLGGMPNFFSHLRKWRRCCAILTRVVVLLVYVKSSEMWVPRHLRHLTLSTAVCGSRIRICWVTLISKMFYLHNNAFVRY